MLLHGSVQLSVRMLTKLQGPMTPSPKSMQVGKCSWAVQVLKSFWSLDLAAPLLIMGQYPCTSPAFALSLLATITRSGKGCM